MWLRAKSSGALIAASVIAGCGGDDGPGTKTVPPVTYANYLAQDNALRAAFASAPTTDPASLLLSGGASYSGVMVIDAEVATGVLPMSGALGMQADFATATIAGQAGSFRDSANVAYQGQLVLANGLIDRGADTSSQYTFSADLAGTLSGGGENFDVTAIVQGDFLGTGHNGVLGIVTGSAVSSLGSGFFFGDFIASQ